MIYLKGAEQAAAGTGQEVLMILILVDEE